jgi:hypothetical protein
MDEIPEELGEKAAPKASQNDIWRYIGGGKESVTSILD